MTMQLSKEFLPCMEGGFWDRGWNLKLMSLENLYLCWAIMLSLSSQCLKRVNKVKRSWGGILQGLLNLYRRNWLVWLLGIKFMWYWPIVSPILLCSWGKQTPSSGHFKVWLEWLSILSKSPYNKLLDCARFTVVETSTVGVVETVILSILKYSIRKNPYRIFCKITKMNKLLVCVNLYFPLLISNSPKFNSTIEKDKCIYLIWRKYRGIIDQIKMGVKL